jgi:RNA polymerase sigma factor (sigma-70 family)
MSFPQTRYTLIQRIVNRGEEKDWAEFLKDYWGPICRFAMRWGNLTFPDAEDVAAATLAAVVQNRLLSRWASERAAKLRTLLCAVVRNILANRSRVEAGRERLLRTHGGRLDDRGGLPLVASLDAPADQVDAFFAAWVEEILHQAIEMLLGELHEAGKGDHFRVLYGRVCEDMTTPEIASALGLTTTTVENHYKQARKKLAESLRELVRAHVDRYCPEEEAAAEFATEWGRLGAYLKENGGLEEAVRRSYGGADPLTWTKTLTASRKAVQKQLTALLAQAP